MFHIVDFIQGKGASLAVFEVFTEDLITADVKVIHLGRHRGQNTGLN